MATGAKITGAVTRWWWVRHAVVPNPERRCYGQSDMDCDVSNEELFRHQAKLLPRGAVWYASNLLRARKTAEHLAKAGAEMDKLHIDPDLAEQHFGNWQGLTYVEIAENHADNHLFWLGPPEFRPEGGESFVDLRDRTVRSIDRLTAEHKGRDIVAIQNESRHFVGFGGDEGLFEKLLKRNIGQDVLSDGAFQFA